MATEIFHVMTFEKKLLETAHQLIGSEADGALLLAFDVCPDDKYVHYVLDESPDGYKFSIQFEDKYNWEKEE